jgi:hypothetical protein
VPRESEQDHLRHLTDAAIAGFEVLQTGHVGIGGSTGALVLRNLKGIRAALVSRTRAEVAPPSTLDELAIRR